jgi:ribosomal protein L23
VEVEKGQNVTATIKGEEQEAVVLEVMEDEGKIKVKTKAGKVFKLDPDKVAVITEEEEKPKKKKVTKETSSLKKKSKKK